MSDEFYDFKRCVDCEHYLEKNHFDGATSQLRASGICTFIIDPVTGEVGEGYASSARFAGMCGPSARFFSLKTQQG